MSIDPVGDGSPHEFDHGGLAMISGPILAFGLALIAVLGVSIGVVGALWWRQPTAPALDPAALARDVAQRLRMLDRADRGRSEGPRSSLKPTRIDLPGPTLIAVPDLATTSKTLTTNSAEMTRKYGAIWALHDTGATAAAISRTTGQPVGQVELILALRRPQGS